MKACVLIRDVAATELCGIDRQLAAGEIVYAETVGGSSTDETSVACRLSPSAPTIVYVPASALAAYEGT